MLGEMSRVMFVAIMLPAALSFGVAVILSRLTGKDVGKFLRIGGIGIRRIEDHKDD